MSEREQLKRMAEAATQGEWDTCILDGTEPLEWGVHVPGHNDAFVKPDQTWHAITVCRGMTGPAKEANAEYIAAANPSTILALLSQLESSEAALRTLRQAAGNVECSDCFHPLSLHADKDGCQFDRGDKHLGEAEISVAVGPCSCKGGCESEGGK